MITYYYGSQRTVGRCSICGGTVTVPTLWWATIPPTPTCQSCGARAAAPKLPVVPMDPPCPPTPIYPSLPEPEVRRDPGLRPDLGEDIRVTPVYPGTFFR